MTLQEAINTLDSVIPHPQNKMVDHEHFPIAAAWQECRKTLIAYTDMQDRHDTLMRRWEGMVEAIRRRIDAGQNRDARDYRGGSQGRERDQESDLQAVGRRKEG